MVAVLAVLIVAVAASCVNVGKALQKQGTKSLPREISLVTLPTYLADATWRRGLVLDICGGLLMVVALAIAPVSLVQPVASGGVAVLAVYSHVHLEEKLATREWGGVVAAVIGTVGLGLSSEAQPTEAMSTGRVLFGAAVVAAAVRAPGWLVAARAARKRTRTQHRGGVGGAKTAGVVGGGSPHHTLKSHPLHPGSRDAGVSGARGRVEEVASGARAGMFFSLSALAVKIGFTLRANRGSTTYLVVGLAASGALTARGLICQTKGLKDGNSVVVCTCGNVAQMITSVVFGVLVLGERLPLSTWARFRGWALSWTLVLVGVVVISGVGWDDLPAEFSYSGGGGGGARVGGGLGGLSGLGALRRKGANMFLPVMNPSSGGKQDV